MAAEQRSTSTSKRVDGRGNHRARQVTKHPSPQVDSPQLAPSRISCFRGALADANTMMPSCTAAQTELSAK